MKRLFLAATVLGLWTSSGFARSGANLAESIDLDYDHLRELFEHFHRHPELSFLEHATAERLARELRELGFEVTEGVGGTGVVAVMVNGDGPTVMVRADMDGLPVEEKSGLDYASKARQVNLVGNEVPVMHACGHDVHMTSLVGTARQLVAKRDAWRGTLMLIGQPAEERIGGAKAMVEDGLYERFPLPDHALAFHVSSALPAGKITFRPGLMFSSSDSVDIVVHGVGAHGAAPHKGKDPIVLGSQIVLALQTLVARELSPLEPGVVTVGAFHAGLKHNIISNEARLQLTVRANSEQTRQTLLDGIERIAKNLGRAAGLPEDKLPDVIRSIESTPTTHNDPALSQRIRRALAAHFPSDRFTHFEQTSMGAEDFPYFTRVDPPIPGLYFLVGGTPKEAFEAEKSGGPPVPSHHSPLFKVAPEPSIKTGVEATVVAVLELMGADT